MSFTAWGSPAYFSGSAAAVDGSGTVFFGVIPEPLVDFASHAGASLFS